MMMTTNIACRLIIDKQIESIHIFKCKISSFHHRFALKHLKDFGFGRAGLEGVIQVMVRDSFGMKSMQRMAEPSKRTLNVLAPRPAHICLIMLILFAMHFHIFFISGRTHTYTSIRYWDRFIAYGKNIFHIWKDHILASPYWIG